MPDAPGYWLRVDGAANPPGIEALTEALAAFLDGELDRASAAFDQAAAAVGPGSPLDHAAIRFNLAMVAEARGDRETALGILNAIGDAIFPAALAEARRRLLGAP